MNGDGAPLEKDLVLIGGGHAHVHVLKMFGMPEGRQWVQDCGIQVTLIARDIHTPYSGMLPGFVAGHYTFDEIHLDLQQLCRFSNIRLIHASATQITYNENNNNNGGTIICDDGRPPLRYDALSIDIGSSPRGAPPQHVIPVKPIAHFGQQYQRLQQRLRQQSFTSQDPFRLVVVGGGAGGIELALAVQYNLQSILSQQQQQSIDDSIQVIVVTRGSKLLSQHNSSVQRIFKRILKEKNIKVYTNTNVIGVEESCEAPLSEKPTTTNGNGHATASESRIKKRLVIENSKQDDILFDECLWCTSAGTSSWLAENTPFETTKDGFLMVDQFFQAVRHPGVFAAGDCSHFCPSPRPKAGVFAVRAGPPLLINLQKSLDGVPLVAHSPQVDFLSLISTGSPHAVASRGSWFAFEGKWIWRLKDYIDRKWMNKYSILPDLEEMMEEMKKNKKPKKTRKNNKQQSFNSSSSLKKMNAAFHPDTVESHTAAFMRCGGCGAKVGASTVSRVLKALYKRQVRRSKEFNLPFEPKPIDHDDAALVPIPKKSSNDAYMIYTIDYFRSFLSDPFVFGKIAAIHALSDVHAMAAQAQTALALAVVPFAERDELTESTLLDMLAGASDVFQDEGVQIIGGHTCEGHELACGFSIQGYSPTSNVLRKRGGRPGDVIVLTKPLGTGALFASDMRAKTKGRHVASAIASMSLSNYKASQLAAEFNNNNDDVPIHACTDVTGFGLVGHLLEMLLANEEEESIGAVLKIPDIPFLEGGLEASKHGIYSSLQPQNAKSRRAVINHVEAVQTYPTEYPLLFDPQTAGGLLFFVHPDKANDLVRELSRTYPCTSAIGQIVSYNDNPSSGIGENDNVPVVCSIGGKSTGLRIKIE